MGGEKRGFFSTPYGKRELFRLANSSESLERWEAANALGDLDEQTGSKLFDLLKGDHDSLVQKALANHEDKFASNHVSSVTPISGASGGAFREAWAQPLGPLKTERLSAMAGVSAIEGVRTQNRASSAITFPQANSVETLMAMLDQILDTNSIHGRKLGLVDRQVLYYRDALRFLGLVEMTSQKMVVANPKIPKLKTAYQRLEFTIHSFLQCQSVAAAYLGMRGEPSGNDFIAPVSAKDYVAYFSHSPDSSGLSGSTLIRRSQTALAWATQIMNILGVQVKDPAAWKAVLPRYLRLDSSLSESS